MEMAVIAAVAIVAFAVVLLPLFRRGARTAADEREFATDETPGPAAVDGPVAPSAVRTGTPVAPTARAAADETPVSASATADDIELEVLRYRTALRAGTVCARCGQANPSGSAFCFDCGRSLPRADAREFE